MIRTKRVYEEPDKGDGYRVLVDRLWPRGLAKERAGVDLWMKEIAPSDALRKWFHHGESHWRGFVKNYKAELEEKKELLSELKKMEKQHGIITLLYGSKDEKQNQAVVLVGILKGKK